MVEVLNFMGILSKYWNKDDFMLLTVFYSVKVLIVEEPLPASCRTPCCHLCSCFGSCIVTFLRLQKRCCLLEERTRVSLASETGLEGKMRSSIRGFVTITPALGTGDWASPCCREQGWKGQGREVGLGEQRSAWLTLMHSFLSCKNRFT